MQRRRRTRCRCCICSVSTVAPGTTTSSPPLWIGKGCCWPMTLRRPRAWGWPCCGRCWPSVVPARQERLPPLLRRAVQLVERLPRAGDVVDQAAELELLLAVRPLLPDDHPAQSATGHPRPVAGCGPRQRLARTAAHPAAGGRARPPRRRAPDAARTGIGRSRTRRCDPDVGRHTEPAGSPTDPGGAGPADGSRRGRPTVGRASRRWSSRLGVRLAGPGAASWLRTPTPRAATSGWVTGWST